MKNKLKYVPLLLASMYSAAPAHASECLPRDAADAIHTHFNIENVQRETFLGVSEENGDGAVDSLELVLNADGFIKLVAKQTTPTMSLRSNLVTYKIKGAEYDLTREGCPPVERIFSGTSSDPDIMPPAITSPNPKTLLGYGDLLKDVLGRASAQFGK